MLENDEETNSAVENTPNKEVQEEIENYHSIYEIKTLHFDEFELCRASAVGDFKAVRKLLSENIKVDSRDAEGFTSLHLASKYGHYEIIKILLLNGADVNVITADLVTPLHLAAFHGHVNVIKLLALSKADLNAVTKSGCRPIDLVPYDSERWKILKDASLGILPYTELLKETLDLPVIPAFAVKPTEKEGGKKKGKKSGKKKSGKKSGKKGRILNNIYMMTNGSYDWDAFYNINHLQQSRNREDHERLNQLLHAFGDEHGWKVCASFLLRDNAFQEIYNQFNDLTMKDFFCFRGIEEFIKTWYPNVTNNETIDQVHMFILKMLNSYASNKIDKKDNILRNKCIHVATRVAINDYPTRWPSFFKDFINIIQNNSTIVSKDFDGKTIPISLLAAFELFFKFLISWDAEVCSREMQTNQFIERNTAIKDWMREHDIVGIMEIVLFVIKVIGVNNTALLKKALKVTSLYISWVDIHLIVNDSTIDGIIKPLIPNIEFDDNVKAASLDCLLGIVNKGMSPAHKLDLIEFLNLKLESQNVWEWLELFKNIPDDMGQDFGVDEDEMDNCVFVTLGSLINAFGQNLIDSFKYLKEIKSDLIINCTRMMHNKMKLALTVAKSPNNTVSATCLPFIQNFIVLLKSIYQGDTKKLKRGMMAKPAIQINDDDMVIVRNCLSLLATKIQYPTWYNFDKEDEPEGNFQNYRRQLLTVLTNIIQLNDQIVLKYLSELLNNVTKHCGMMQYQEVEMVLTMIYHLGEAVKSVKGDYFCSNCEISVTLKDLMQVLCSGEIGRHKNPEVRLMFFETIFRYEKYFNYHTENLMSIIFLFLSEHGLKSNSMRVVTRCVYILSRLIKMHKSKFGNMSLTVLQEITTILQSSFVNNAILTCQNQSTISSYSYLYETAAMLLVSLDINNRHSIFHDLIGPIVFHVPQLCDEWAKAAALAMPSTDPVLYSQNQHNIKANHIAFSIHSAATYINYTCRAFSGPVSMSGLHCLDVYMNTLDTFITGLQQAFIITKHPLAVGREKINSGLRSLIHILCKCAQSDSAAISALLQRLPMAIELFLAHLSLNQHGLMPLCTELEEIIPLFMQIINAFKSHCQSFLKSALWTLFSISESAIKTSIAAVDYNCNDIANNDVHEKVRQLRRLYLQLISCDIQLIFSALTDDQILQLLSSCIQLIHNVDQIDATSIKLCVQLFHKIISIFPTLTNPSDPHTKQIIFYQLIYKQLLPLIIYLPSCDKFNLSDAQFHLTLVEMANCQRAMFLNGGTQFIQYLQVQCLPELNFSSDLILQYCQALNHHEKDYQNFLKNFYLQTKSK